MKTIWLSFECAAISFMRRYNQKVLRASLALVFIWFGALKPLGLSPAAPLIAATVSWWPAEVFIPVLGIWEVLIGLFFIFPATTKFALILMAAQMGGTFLPLVLLPGQVFADFPFVFTLTGQYVVKNVVLIGAAMAIGATLKSKN